MAAVTESSNEPDLFRLQAVREPPLSAHQEFAQRVSPALVAFITSVVVVAAVSLTAVAPDIGSAAIDDTTAFVGFALLTLLLQALAVESYGAGGEALSAVGILAAGFRFGPGAAAAIAVAAAVTQSIRKRGLFHRAIFDASNFCLSALISAAVFHVALTASSSTAPRLVVASMAGVVYKGVNVGLLCIAMALSEARPVQEVWSERYRWARLYYPAFGVFALAMSMAYAKLGLVGLAAFALPPALIALSVRQYVDRTRASVTEVRLANRELRRAHAELAESHERVRKTHLQTIAALGRSIEAKDYYTGGHTERVALIAVALASRLGFANEDLEAIEIGALLHDIGKIGVPEHVLHKPGPLDDDEWVIMRKHPVISDRILTGIDLHPYVRQIARWSHERIDGTGYPDRLAGDQIPIAARVVFVADAFDALTSRRPYREPYPVEWALQELRANAGTQFCPRVIEALDRVWFETPQILISLERPLLEERPTVLALANG
jgi:putative nucleotidyltransferase with HDIG domain